MLGGILKGINIKGESMQGAKSIKWKVHALKGEYNGSCEP